MNLDAVTANGTATGWVPQGCTLPTAEQPLRVAEFDQLFSTGLLATERLAPTVLRLRLDDALRVRSQELAERETSCCSFFAFTFSGTADVVMDVAVPAPHVGVLDALAERARVAAGLPR